LEPAGFLRKYRLRWNLRENPGRNFQVISVAAGCAEGPPERDLYLRAERRL